MINEAILDHLKGSASGREVLFLLGYISIAIVSPGPLAPRFTSCNDSETDDEVGDFDYLSRVIPFPRLPETRPFESRRGRIQAIKRNGKTFNRARDTRAHAQ
ncbi:MAG: hypothetical protein ACTSUE_00595 [Promethearchaeota archaeon]